MITLCTQPHTCADLIAANASLAEQNGELLLQVARLTVQLDTANATAEKWRTLYEGALEGKAFYENAYAAKFKEATR